MNKWDKWDKWVTLWVKKRKEENGDVNCAELPIENFRSYGGCPVKALGVRARVWRGGE